jgi:hypothetical protein
MMTLAAQRARLARLQQALDELVTRNAAREERQPYEEAIAAIRIDIARLEKAARPKVTPIFRTSPAPASSVAITAVNAFGRPTEEIECVNAEAASHWDVRYWRRLT